MQKKLNTAFLLVLTAMVSIIGFQIYWTVTAYNVNRKAFNVNINVAMQEALDQCKKDYFDSVRRVLVPRVADTGMLDICIDTNRNKYNPQIVDGYNINIGSPKSSQMVFMTPQMFSISKRNWDYYQFKFNFLPTNAQFITEMAFYEPKLMSMIITPLMMLDFATQKNKLALNGVMVKYKGAARDTFISHHTYYVEGIMALPPDFKDGEKARLNHYFKAALTGKDISADYDLYLNTQHADTTTLGQHSSTAEVEYKYFGMKMFGYNNETLYARAIFPNSDGAVLRAMILTLIFSALLIVLTAIAFRYTMRLIFHQKKLADLKDDFINNMTHELKTPIATIGVALEGLQNFNALNDPEKTQRYLETSRLQLNHLNQLVSKVLNIASLENQYVTLQRIAVPVNQVINEVIASEKVKTRKAVSVTYQNNSGVQNIDADATHFRNIISNLLDNAIKYSADTPQVQITCTADEYNLYIEVKDNGVGLSRPNQELIFDKFYRVPTGNVHNVKGTGLGLSYVKYITEAHGGTISVKSELGVGSTFTVSLPLSNG